MNPDYMIVATTTYTSRVGMPSDVLFAVRAGDIDEDECRSMIEDEAITFTRRATRKDYVFVKHETVGRGNRYTVRLLAKPSVVVVEYNLYIVEPIV